MGYVGITLSLNSVLPWVVLLLVAFPRVVPFQVAFLQVVLLGVAGVLDSFGCVWFLGFFGYFGSVLLLRLVGDVGNISLLLLLPCCNRCPFFTGLL